MADTLVVARVAFTYTRWRDKGEVFRLLPDARNNRVLEAGRYFRPFSPKEDKEILCDNCGRKFCNEFFFEGHKRKRKCDDEVEMTKQEFADLIGADPDKVVIET